MCRFDWFVLHAGCFVRLQSFNIKTKKLGIISLNYENKDKKITFGFKWDRRVGLAILLGHRIDSYLTVTKNKFFAVFIVKLLVAKRTTNILEQNTKKLCLYFRKLTSIPTLPLI